MAESGFCVFDCGTEIDPDRDYRKVVGFERHRQQGGTNALRLRQPQDEWACRWCVERQAKGLAVGQGTML